MTLSPSIAKLLKQEDEDSLDFEYDRDEEEETPVRAESVSDIERPKEDISSEDERLINTIKRFGKQITVLDANFAIKKKRGTDYKIYSLNPKEPNLFPFVSSSRQFSNFLNFVNACFTMKVDEEIPRDYFSDNLLRYLSEDRNKELLDEIAEICQDTQLFAEKKLADKNGFDALVLTYEKMYGGEFQTPKSRKQKATAFNDILQFLRTGKQPAYEYQSAIKRLSSMSAEIALLQDKIPKLRESFEDKLNSDFFSDKLKNKLRMEAAVLINKPSSKISEYMEKLPEELLTEIISMYEQEVIPKVKQEIEDVKANKKGSLRTTKTQKMQEEIKNLQEDIDSKEAQLKNLSKNKIDKLRSSIAKEKEAIEAWRKKNFKRDAKGNLIRDEKISETYRRKENKLNRFIAQKTKEMSQVGQAITGEVTELENSIKQSRELLTQKKLQMSQRKRKLGSKENMAMTLQELEEMLNSKNYNREHLRILRTELMGDYVEEKLEDFLDEKKEQYKKNEEKLRKQENRFSRVSGEISTLKEISKKITKVVQDIEEITALLLGVESVTQERRASLREQLGESKKTLRLFVGAEQTIVDIVKTTERMLEQYESMDEYMEESLTMTLRTIQVLDEVEEDLEEEMSESQEVKIRLRNRIDKDMNILQEKIDELQERTKEE